MVPVRFASSQYFDTEHGVILFTAFSNHRIVPCAITVDALVAQFGADAAAPLSAFSRYRDQIERVAEELIGENRIEADGSIRISASDCSWLSAMNRHPHQSVPSAATL